MFFERIFKKLNDAKIKYLLIGGVAVNLHGFNRATGDVDILISLDSVNVKKFVNMVKKLKWKSRTPALLEAFMDEKNRKDWIKNKGMKVFSVYNPKNEIEHIDVMMENHIDFGTAYRNRKSVSLGHLSIPVASIPHLIKLKKIAGRERDLIDIRALEEIERLKNE